MIECRKKSSHKDNFSYLSDKGYYYNEEKNGIYTINISNIKENNYINKKIMRFLIKPVNDINNNNKKININIDNSII